MANLSKLIERFLNVVEKHYLRHYKLEQLTAQTMAVATDRAKESGCQTDCSHLAADVLRHQRNRNSARKALVKIGGVLAVELERQSEDSTLTLDMLDAAQHRGGPSAVLPLWPSLTVRLQKIAIRHGNANATPPSVKPLQGEGHGGVGSGRSNSKNGEVTLSVSRANLEAARDAAIRCFEVGFNTRVFAGWAWLNAMMDVKQLTPEAATERIAEFLDEARQQVQTIDERCQEAERVLAVEILDYIAEANAPDNLPGATMGGVKYTTAHQGALPVAKTAGVALTGILEGLNWGAQPDRATCEAIIKAVGSLPSPEFQAADIEREAAMALAKLSRTNSTLPTAKAEASEENGNNPPLPRSIQEIPDAELRWQAGRTWQAATDLIDCFKGFQCLIERLETGAEVSLPEWEKLFNKAGRSANTLCDTEAVAEDITPIKIIAAFPKPPDPVAGWQKQYDVEQALAKKSPLWELATQLAAIRTQAETCPKTLLTPSTAKVKQGKANGGAETDETRPQEPQSLVEIAEAARLLYTCYPQSADEYRRAKRALQFLRDAESRAHPERPLTAFPEKGTMLYDATHDYKTQSDQCRYKALLVGELGLAVAKRLPRLWPSLRLVGIGARWHEDEDFDWDAAIGELRQIETIAFDTNQASSADDTEQSEGNGNSPPLPACIQEIPDETLRRNAGRAWWAVGQLIGCAEGWLGWIQDFNSYQEEVSRNPNGTGTPDFNGPNCKAARTWLDNARKAAWVLANIGISDPESFPAGISVQEIMARFPKKPHAGAVLDRKDYTLLDGVTLGLCDLKTHLQRLQEKIELLPETLFVDRKALLAAPTEQGEANRGTVATPEQPATNPNVNRKEVLDKLEPADRKAYLAYQYAETMAEKRLQDREAYDWLDENKIDTDKGNVGELTDYQLPAFDTWTKQLRNARKPLGEQKYARRAGRATSRSIVSGRDIERQQRGKQ